MIPALIVAPNSSRRDMWCIKRILCCYRQAGIARDVIILILIPTPGGRRSSELFSQVADGLVLVVGVTVLGRPQQRVVQRTVEFIEHGFGRAPVLVAQAMMRRLASNTRTQH